MSETTKPPITPPPIDMPPMSFFHDNHKEISSILAQCAKTFPDSGAAETLRLLSDQPDHEVLRWMWANFMGHQHGTSTEGVGTKLNIDAHEDRHLFVDLADQLHYAGQRLTEHKPASSDKFASTLLIPGGLPQEIIRRIRAGLPLGPESENFGQVIVLAGQRLRWAQALGERSVGEIFSTIHQETDISPDQIASQSQLLHEQEQITGHEDPWGMRFATEFEIGRLCVETFFAHYIDWDDGVLVVVDSSAEVQTSERAQASHSIPVRQVSSATYRLRDSRHVTVLNAKAVERAKGEPRPNCESQAAELVELGLVKLVGERLGIASSAPHLRGGLDIILRLIASGVSLKSAELYTSPQEPGASVLSALGEIPATHKADLRLRAVLCGQSPDSPDLLSL